MLRDAASGPIRPQDILPQRMEKNKLHRYSKVLDTNIGDVYSTRSLPRCLKVRKQNNICTLYSVHVAIYSIITNLSNKLSHLFIDYYIIDKFDCFYKVKTNQTCFYLLLVYCLVSRAGASIPEHHGPGQPLQAAETPVRGLRGPDTSQGPGPDSTGRYRGI